MRIGSHIYKSGTEIFRQPLLVDGPKLNICTTLLRKSSKKNMFISWAGQDMMLKLYGAWLILNFI